MQFFLRLADGSASLLDIFARCVQACLQLGRDSVGFATLCALLCIQCDKTLRQCTLHRLRLALNQCPNSIHSVGSGWLNRYFTCYHRDVSFLCFVFTFRLQRYNIYAKYANVWAKILRDSAKLAFYGNSNTSKNRFIYSRGALVGCFVIFWGGQNTFRLFFSCPSIPLLPIYSSLAQTA